MKAAFNQPHGCRNIHALFKLEFYFQNFRLQLLIREGQMVDYVQISHMFESVAIGVLIGETFGFQATFITGVWSSTWFLAYMI
jgi:hypothetical protein